MSKVSRYVGNIAGTNAYWNRGRDDLKAIITSVGAPTLFFTFSHVVDWFFTQRLENFVKTWLYDTLVAKWHC